MTVIQVTCPGCGKDYLLKPALAGKSAKCKCGTRIQVPELVPVYDSGELELEPPIEAPTATPPPIVEAPRTKDDLPFSPTMVDPSEEQEDSEGNFSEAGLKFVSVYGVLVMGFAGLVGLASTVFMIHIAFKMSEQPLFTFIGLLIAAANAMVWFIVYRMGEGLSHCERNAVQGMAAFFVLCLAISALAALKGVYDVAVLFALTAICVFLPPMIVGYLNWDGFHTDD
ncbi:hypothetical protein [Aeoliella sp.]|uniref:hypothetical protein n=1 Tax=Aeoliella sp. TaxID=2795800 RepID=UPI003CCBA039